MRRAFSNVTLLSNENEKEVIGVSLGYDYCAEHEWGIEDLNRKFGVNTSGLFYETKITKHEQQRSFLSKKDVESCIYYFEQGDYAMLTTGIDRWSDEEYNFDNQIPMDLKSYKDADLLTAWDGGGFCVISKNKEALKLIYDNFLKLNIVFKFYKGSKNNPFENASLSILIADRVPKEFVDTYNKNIFDKRQLDQDVKDCGLAKLMKEKEKSQYSNDYDPAKGHKCWMALSPKRTQLKDSKYNFAVWANYPDGEDAGYGWYRVEDVLEWLQTPNIKLSEVKRKNNPKLNPETHTVDGHKIPKKVREQLKEK